MACFPPDATVDATNLVLISTDMFPSPTLVNCNGIQVVAFHCDTVLGKMTILQQAVADKMVAKFGVVQNKDKLMVVGLTLEQFGYHQ